MKLRIETRWANFRYALLANVPEASLSAETEKLAKLGLASEAYRAGNSLLDKTFNVGKENGPKSRDAIGWSKENEDKLVKALAAEKLEAIGLGEWTPAEPQSHTKTAEAFLAAMAETMKSIGQDIAVWRKANVQAGESDIDAAKRILKAAKK